MNIKKNSLLVVGILAILAILCYFASCGIAGCIEKAGNNESPVDEIQFLTTERDAAIKEKEAFEKSADEHKKKAAEWEGKFNDSEKERAKLKKNRPKKPEMPEICEEIMDAIKMGVSDSLTGLKSNDFDYIQSMTLVCKEIVSQSIYSNSLENELFQAEESIENCKGENKELKLSNEDLKKAIKKADESLEKQKELTQKYIDNGKKKGWKAVKKYGPWIFFLGVIAGIAIPK